MWKKLALYRNPVFPLEYCIGFSKSWWLHAHIAFAPYYLGLALVWQINPVSHKGDVNVLQADILLPLVRFHLTYKWGELG